MAEGKYHREMGTYTFETDEHKELRAQIRRFALNSITPHANAWEEAEEFPIGLYRESAEAGFLGLGYPEEWGGVGGDFAHAMVAAEELLVAGKSVGTVVGLGSLNIAVPSILVHGTDEQKERYVRPALRGQKIAALAITEPGGGSDVASLRTTATLDGDHYVVNGSKTFITSGTRADYISAAVRTGGEGHAGVSMLLIDADTPGYSVGSKLKKTGWWASDTAELHFDDCRVPASNLLGHVGGGFGVIMTGFVAERIMLASQCVAIMDLAYAESVAYAQERRAFGKSLTGFQVIRHKLADISTRLAAARALTGNVMQAHLRGEATPSDAAQAKNCASDACSWVCDQAVQIFGGYGYMRESVVERLYRDARLYPIGGGTREIMNEIIAKFEGY